jgi:hypothetical protein
VAFRGRDRWLLAVGVAVLALVVRFDRPPRATAFAPRPDALEYVAAAQAIAAEGRYYLQVGPHRVRPMYPPGLPLLLAAGLRAGVPPTDLWRVSAASGALAAALAALLAAELATRLAPLLRRATAPPRAVGWVAGLAAGLAWAYSPVSFRVSRAVLSDGPAGLLGMGSLLLLAVACFAGAGRRGALLAAVGAGLAAGATMVTRPASATLLAVPAGVLMLAALVAPGRKVVARRLLTAGAALAVAPLLVFLLLHRSGLPPLPWSGYHFWLPHEFADAGNAFGVGFALEAREALGAGGSPLSNAELGARTLLGLPGVRRAHSAGKWWPLLGWVGALLAWKLARRGDGATRRIATAAGLALLGWTAAHLALFSLYRYSGGRFYLPVLLCLAALFGVACGLAVARSGRWWPGAAAVVALVLVALLPGYFSQWQVSPPTRHEQAVPQRVARWLAWDDSTRARRPLRFDPVYAQALGLLPPPAIAAVSEWGALPDTWHVRWLVRNGHLAASEVASSASPARQPRARRGKGRDG